MLHLPDTSYRCADCDCEFIADSYTTECPLCESTNIVKEEYNGYHSTKKETKDSKRHRL